MLGKKLPRYENKVGEICGTCVTHGRYTY